MTVSVTAVCTNRSAGRALQRSRTTLRFSKTGNPHIEQAYATHWIGPTQQAHQQQRAEQSHHRPTPGS